MIFLKRIQKCTFSFKKLECFTTTVSKRLNLHWLFIFPILALDTKYFNIPLTLQSAQSAERQYVSISDNDIMFK